MIRNKVFLLLAIFCLSSLYGMQPANAGTVLDLRTEDLVNPLGIERERPRLSWRMESDRQGAAQSAYQILCASSESALQAGQADLWDSGKVVSDQQRLLVFGGKVLAAGAPHFWKVRIWNESGEPTSWSPVAHWSRFDRFADKDWDAKWITLDLPKEKGSRASPMLRRVFQLEQAPERAVVYINALGFFELHINGQRVSDDVFTPHVGQYNKRSFAITYDVTQHLKPGENVMALWLGSGWSTKKAGIKLPGPIVRARLEMLGPEDGEKEILTDEAWRAHPGYLETIGGWDWGKFGGERYHAGRELSGWTQVGFNDNDWAGAALVEYPDRPVSAEMMQRNKVLETIRPVSVSLAGEDEASGTRHWLVDMGKAMTGTFKINFPPGPEGHQVQMRFADERASDVTVDGVFGQRSEYIYRGSGEEVFRNRFNWASCRYIMIRNVPPGELTVSDIEGQFISAELPQVSHFECSDRTLNQIYAMMEHTLQCLMLGGYQVDCHSRERMGYGGDAHASLDTTLSLYRSDAFLRKWTRDWMDGQGPDGHLTYTAPVSRHGGGPFWSGFLIAATLKHYQHYGDLELVQRNYPAIQQWLELAQSKMKDGLQEKFIRRSWYLGDWASPGVDDKANADVFIQAYMPYALEQAAQLADILGEAADAERFREWAGARAAAAHQKHFNPQEHTYGSGDQVTSIVPLIAGVVPEELERAVFKTFEETLRNKDEGHLSTGLSGTYLMIQYLQSIGRDDLIYLFASKKTLPSWGYMIENGATATWEYFSGAKGTRIHNCFNSIGSWFIQGLAGIRPDPDQPGFKNAVIQPAFLPELDFVKGSHQSVYGTISCEWERKDGLLKLKIRVPPNSTASLHLPDEAWKEVEVNGTSVRKHPHVDFLNRKEGRAVLKLASGQYELSVPEGTD